MLRTTETRNDRTITMMREGTLAISIFNLGEGEPPLGTYHLERRRKSPLANPFYLSEESQRDHVCEMFEEMLSKGHYHGLTLPDKAQQLLHTLELELRERGELSLACWCAPRRCHTESVAKLLIHRVRDLV